MRAIAAGAASLPDTVSEVTTPMPPDDTQRFFESQERLASGQEKLTAELAAVVAEMRANKSGGKPSWAAYASIFLSLILLLVTVSRWTAISDTSFDAQKQLVDLKFEMTKQETKALQKELDDMKARAAVKEKQVDDDLSLLRTRVDNVDRRLANGGIK